MTNSVRFPGLSRNAAAGALGCVLASGLLLVPAMARAAPEAGLRLQGPADLAGLWELDPEESDDPAEVMQRAAAENEDRRGARGSHQHTAPN